MITLKCKLFQCIIICTYVLQFTNTSTRILQITESLRKEISVQCVARNSCLPEFEQNLSILEEEFVCTSGNRPLYRAQLRAEQTQSCVELDSILKEWIEGGSATVVVQGNRLSIANFCEVQINSATDPINCSEPTTEPPTTSEPTVTTSRPGLNLTDRQAFGIAGGIAGFILLVVSIGLIIIIVTAVLKGKTKK